MREMRFWPVCERDADEGAKSVYTYIYIYIHSCDSGTWCVSDLFENDNAYFHR